MKVKKYKVYIHIFPNNKVYIGITCQEPRKRWRNGKGYNRTSYIYNAIVKYGWNNVRHLILYDNLTKEEATKKEIELIAKYKSNQRKHGYNNSSGGEISALGFHHKEETKKIISQKLKKINLGKHLSIETKRKISKAKLGKPMKKETIIKKSKPVICVETNVVYYGIHEAQNQTQINDRNINNCLKGRRKTAGGYHWRYYENN